VAAHPAAAIAHSAKSVARGDDAPLHPTARLSAARLSTAAPSIAISYVSRSEGQGGQTAFAFTVSLSAPSSKRVSVDYQTADAGATAGSDYQAASGKLQFVPGETTKIITVLVNGDTIPEPTESFVIVLSRARNATIAESLGWGTILDDDGYVPPTPPPGPPPLDCHDGPYYPSECLTESMAATATAATMPSLTISDVSRSEGQGGQTAFVFTVSLSAPSSRIVSVNFSTADGTATRADNDYLRNSGTLKFAPGETTKTITVLVNGDTKIEATERFFVNLSRARNAVIAGRQGVGTILNDDDSSVGGGCSINNPCGPAEPDNGGESPY
jgi:hypothetical protein